MAKSLPRHNFLAKPLIGSQSGSRSRQTKPTATYPCDLLQVTCLAYPQNFDGDFPTLMFSLPHVCEPALVQRNALSVVARRDVKGFRKDGVATAYLVQGFETFLSDLWWGIELVQRLVRYVDESLGVVPMEGANDIALILTRENSLNQGEELVRGECALDQSFTCCNIDIEAEEGGALAFEPGR